MSINSKNTNNNTKKGLGRDFSNEWPQFVEYHYKNLTWRNEKFVYLGKCSKAPGLKYKDTIYMANGRDKQYVGRRGCYVERYLNGVPEWATPDMIKRYNEIVFNIKKKAKKRKKRNLA